jgi:hypothetical protein
MPEDYRPASEFLNAVIAETESVSEGERAEENLRQLIALTRDADRSNRDWAALLLAQTEIDTPAVREALLQAATFDDDDAVRGEATLGLATRDARLALPLIQDALRGGSVTVPILEAAVLCAHPSLVPDLRVWAQPSDHAYADELAAAALVACERAASATDRSDL